MGRTATLSKDRLPELAKGVTLDFRKPTVQQWDAINTPFAHEMVKLPETDKLLYGTGIELLGQLCMLKESALRTLLAERHQDRTHEPAEARQLDNYMKEIKLALEDHGLTLGMRIDGWDKLEDD